MWVMKLNEIFKDVEITDKDYCRFGFLGSDDVWAVGKNGGYTAIGRTLAEALTNYIEHYIKIKGYEKESINKSNAEKFKISKR